MSMATASWYAFEKATTGGELITGNTKGSTLTLQVFGSASAVNLQVFGQVDSKSEAWAVLSAINASTLDVGTSITQKGIYVLSVNGCARIKVQLNSVSGGEITVYGRITEE